MHKTLRLVFLSMLFVASANKDPAVFRYIGFWLVAVVVQRAITVSDARKGYRVHSRYDGYPLVVSRFLFIHKEAWGRAIEPFLCFGIAAFLEGFSHNLACLWMAGGVGIAIVEFMRRQAIRVHVQRLRDAEIENQLIHDRWHGAGDNF